MKISDGGPHKTPIGVIDIDGWTSLFGISYHGLIHLIRVVRNFLCETLNVKWSLKLKSLGLSGGDIDSHKAFFKPFRLLD